MRKAWDTTIDTHKWLRRVRKARLGGDKAPFTSDKALILEVSKLMDLTVHEQDPANAQITPLDVTLTESIARGVGIVGQLAGKEAVTKPFGPFMSKADEDLAARDLLIEASVKKYGKLLGDPARDKKLLDWLVDHYRKLP